MEFKKELVIIGDRILIAPEQEAERTHSGLYLPQGLQSREKVQAGYIIKTGPGYALPSAEPGDEPWSEGGREPEYIPLQVKEGDYALFLRRESIEIEYEKKKYLIIPQAAILAVVRDHETLPEI